MSPFEQGVQEGVEKTAGAGALLAATALASVAIYGGLWLGMGAKKRAAIRKELGDPRLRENLKNMLLLRGRKERIKRARAVLARSQRGK